MSLQTSPQCSAATVTPIKSAVLDGGSRTSTARNSQDIPGGLDFCFRRNPDLRTFEANGSADECGKWQRSHRLRRLCLVLRSRPSPVFSRGVQGERPAGVVVIFTGEQSLGEGVPQRRMVPASQPCSPSRTRMIRQSAGMSWFSSMRIPELPCSCPRGRCGHVPPLILSLWFLR